MRKGQRVCERARLRSISPECDNGRGMQRRNNGTEGYD